MPTTVTPDTLTEIVLPGVVEPDGVIVQERPIPAAGRGQAVVRMLATGVSFAENSMRRNRYPGQPAFPFVPGYDVVGDVHSVGAGVDPALVGRRVGAITKTGGWSTHPLLSADDLLPVPAELDPAVVETVLLNGITAWQMLHRSARVRRGQTILVHGASGGVGTILSQLARHAGVRVIGSASARNHDALRELGVEPVDYHDPDVAQRVRELAPGGLDAVFDNLGGDSFHRSFSALAPGGTLVAYGTATSNRDGSGNMMVEFAGIIGRFALWSLAPNRGRSATFYNFWAGSRLWPSRFRRRLAADLGEVLALVDAGAIDVPIAARLPLAQAAEGLRRAEARDARGKVILTP